MVINLKWCCSKKEGIKLIDPNDNLSVGYLKMSENALGTMNREKNLNPQFAISACYYSMYYALYSVMMKIGVKCEIHSCTLKFMKLLLAGFYSKEDSRIINKAFDVRNTSQYYVDKIIDKEDIDLIFSGAQDFLNKTREVLSRINEKDMLNIREQINIFS